MLVAEICVDLRAAPLSYADLADSEGGLKGRRAAQDPPHTTALPGKGISFPSQPALLTCQELVPVLSHHRAKFLYPFNQETGGWNTDLVAKCISGFEADGKYSSAMIHPGNFPRYYESKM